LRSPKPQRKRPGRGTGVPHRRTVGTTAGERGRIVLPGLRPEAPVVRIPKFEFNWTSEVDREQMLAIYLDAETRFFGLAWGRGEIRAAHEKGDHERADRLTRRANEKQRKLIAATNILKSPDATETARHQAARAVAGDLKPRLRSPAAVRAWKRDGRELTAGSGLSPDEVLWDAMVRGIEEAARTADQRQHVRIGRRWLTGFDGQKILVVPQNFETPAFLWWLASTAYRHASKMAGFAPPGRDGIEWLPDDAIADMADAARARARQQDERNTSDRELLKRRLTPTQRRIVSLRAAGSSVADVAKVLHISPSTVRVHLHRARSAPPQT